MAKSFSYDVVSDYDIAEVTNAVDQAKRELIQRLQPLWNKALAQLL